MRQDQSQRDGPGVTTPVSFVAALGAVVGLVSLAAEGKIAKLLGVPLAVATACLVVMLQRGQKTSSRIWTRPSLIGLGALAALLTVAVVWTSYTTPSASSPAAKDDDMTGPTPSVRKEELSITIARQGSGEMVTPQPLASARGIPLPEAFTDLDEWRRRLRLVHACYSLLVVSIMVQADVSVIFDRIDLTNVRRAPPVNGNVLAVAGGAAAEVQAEVDLDASPPTIAYYKGGRKLPRLNIVLHKGDTLDMFIFASTTRQFVSAQGTMRLVVDGRPTLQSLGSLAATSLQSARRNPAYQSSEGRWTRATTSGC